VSEITRRQLITADIGGKRTALNPPWALAGGAFERSCTGCGECVSVCPEHILFLTSAKKASVRFGDGECTFCGECVDHCSDGALARSDSKEGDQAPWTYQAHIDEKCLASQGVACMSCVEVCDFDAIHLSYQIGTVAVPVLSTENCSGCGACLAPCPVGAIYVGSPGIPENLTTSQSMELK